MEEIYEVEALRKRAVEALAKSGRWMGTGEVAAELGVPTWAALPALERADADGQVHGIDGEWHIVAAAPVSSVTASGRLPLSGGRP